ncbi:MAG: sulfurtransferase [Betaproteobacteria bacterium AqS2]|uniref:Sulfurtransferase n=1 Tax=Candidatus Amphirhobacter heronislandensis TaxID=1732024 RepID=A0A930Y2J2_9GAMM|nr:sulfurtransferase [Betaproteobacteria bacterium AqS2]
MKIQTKPLRLAASAVLAASCLPAMAAPLVDAEWLDRHRGDGQVVVIDIRKEEDYAQGHIPGAIRATYGEFGWRETVDDVIGMLPPLETINAKIGSLGIDPSKHVVVVPYGANSTDVGAAARVYWTFKVLGHDKVSLLDGGINAWTSQDEYVLQTRAVEPAAAAPYPGRVDEQLVIDTAELVAKVESGEVQPVDARTDEQWNGEKKHPKALSFGAIATAQRLPQADLVDPDTGRFVATDEVLKLARAHGWQADGSRPLVSYCNTGHWAATAWFALSEVAGIEDVVLYDGSMVAWTRDEANPLINEPSRAEQLLNKVVGE